MVLFGSLALSSQYVGLQPDLRLAGEQVDTVLTVARASTGLVCLASEEIFTTTIPTSIASSQLAGFAGGG